MMRPFLLACLTFSCALAQPPSLIRVVRQGNIGAYLGGQAPVNVLGMSAIAGSTENWLMELHDSFASLEAVDRAVGRAIPTAAKDAASFPDILSQSQIFIASYRPSLSYRAEEGIQTFAKMRYLDVTVMRVRPGAESDLAKLLKMRSGNLDSVNLDRPEIVYQILSGAPAGTYVVLSPMLSLAVLDAGQARPPVSAEAAEDAMKKLAADTGLEREHVWFRIEPQASRVSDGFASQDPNFWRSQ
jgi:hypothetical protein